MTKDEKIRKEYERLSAGYAFQNKIAGGAKFVFGIDEAGRGPLCGPVAAACCILNEDAGILYLNDSKKISEKKRASIYGEIVEKAEAYGIAMVPPERIDEINILNATLEAMAEAFAKCMDMYAEKLAGQAKEGLTCSMDALDRLPSEGDSVVLVDGNRTVPGIPFRQTAVIGGDSSCPSVSAASILAKVSRDSLLSEYDRMYPEYGFARHKGYGTREHTEAILKYGALGIHRKTFLKKLYGSPDKKDR